MQRGVTGVTVTSITKSQGKVGSIEAMGEGVNRRGQWA